MPQTKITAVQLPREGDLALVIEQELYKLPTEAAHNHFHALAEKADKIQDQARTMSLVSLILCGLELEHIKDSRKAKGEPLSQSGSPLPWKQWVSEHCEFSHKTATKYIKSVKCARAGMLEDFDPENIPETAPSLMSSDELKDACTSLANALQGYGSRRQLYLALDIIKTPQKNTMLENRTDNKGTKKSPGENTAAEQSEIDQPLLNNTEETSK